ncbi:myosin heavy chain [Acrasis kona]|uniref:Myosin heavy chain n=1 Tax=Acrasis kona TaxID=1008807 RepID=A0AAW2Z9U1_9EUKA
MSKFTLSFDSVTESVRVYVEVIECVCDPATGFVQRRKKPLKEEIDNNEERWIVATVSKVDEEGKMIHVICEESTHHPEFSEKRVHLSDMSLISLKNPQHCETADDVTTMSYLHEAGLPDHFYDEQAINTYTNQPLHKQPPHVFAIADNAFRNMLEYTKNQSILVTGESGAGKSETTKYLLKYFAAMGSSKHNVSHVEKQVLKTSPLLEAFGNAKTLRNDNSSRFGKFIEIQFDRSTGNISGAVIRTYLLERSRIVRQQLGERNYHIFYQLLKGASQQERIEWMLNDLNALQFEYTSGGQCPDLTGTDEFAETKDAMTTLGISPDQDQPRLFRLISAILHLGNVKFEPQPTHSDRAQIVESTLHHLECFSALTNIDGQSILKTFLSRKVTAGTESYDKYMDVRQAESCRDSLFESFQVNSLEQFCINWSNEKLQQQYNQHIFKMSQKEYEAEKITFNKVEFNDNQECLDLIEKPPISVMHILDEESKLQNSTFKTLSTKLLTNFSKHSFFAKPRFSDTHFCVKHYADTVTYDTSEFIDKNRDYIVAEQSNLLRTSSVHFILKQIPTTSSAPTANNKNKNNNSGFTFQSVASQFKSSLDQLMEKINSTQPHYIRCIKPNQQKKPNIFSKLLVLKQLKVSFHFQS